MMSSSDPPASIPALLCLFGVPMPKGEKRIESRITGLLGVAVHKPIATLFASYMACAVICFHFRNHLPL